MMTSLRQPQEPRPDQYLNPDGNIKLDSPERMKRERRILM
jgi:hypothetical protein